MAMHLPTLLEFLAKNYMAVIPHRPYPPDLPPCDFLLIPKLKMVLMGRRFNDVTMMPAKLGWVCVCVYLPRFQQLTSGNA
jgi:hypothetical protein